MSNPECTDPNCGCGLEFVCADCGAYVDECECEDADE